MRSLWLFGANETVCLGLALQGFVVSAALLAGPALAQLTIPRPPGIGDLVPSNVTGTCSSGTNSTGRTLTLRGTGSSNANINGVSNNLRVRGVANNLQLSGRMAGFTATLPQIRPLTGRVFAVGGVAGTVVPPGGIVGTARVAGTATVVQRVLGRGVANNVILNGNTFGLNVSGSAGTVAGGGNGLTINNGTTLLNPIQGQWWSHMFEDGRTIGGLFPDTSTTLRLNTCATA